MTTDGADANRVSWDVDVSLLENPVILRAFSYWICITYLVCVVFMSFLSAVRGQWDLIPQFAMIFALICGGLLVLCVVIMLVLYRNKVRMRFAIDDQGIVGAINDRRSSGAGVVATGVGIATANPTLAGAGMIAAAGNGSFTAWPAVVSARYNPRRRTIILRGARRNVGWLVCTPENYEFISARVREIIANPDRKVIKPKDHFFLKHLLGTILIMLAATPLFMLPYPYEIDMFIPLLLLCFALATQWLIPLFAWINLGAIALLAGMLILTYLDRGMRWLDGGEKLLLAAAFTGLVYLVWFSVLMLRGRMNSALMELKREQLGE
jgi:hypothetical protein